MIGDSQLAKVNDPGMQPCSATTVEHACARCQDQTGALHMFCDTNESESCLDKAPAKHSDESVPVVGDLLCDGTEKLRMPGIADSHEHTAGEVPHRIASRAVGRLVVLDDVSVISPAILGG